jgi:hypothetical protein
MNLKPLKANMTEIEIGNKKILFSYQTPVAYKELTPEGMSWYRTNKFWSRTTTRHINSWGPEGMYEPVEQSVLDNLLNEVK